MKALSVHAIEFYQRRLSQHKGYTCAHLSLWGGVSCSEAVRRIVVADGWVGGWGRIKDRFHDCRDAWIVLNESSEPPEGVSEERWAELNKRHSLKDDLLSCDAGRGGCCQYGPCFPLALIMRK